jgi:hypothetical protein
MIRLNIIVEGHTEERFVKEVKSSAGSATAKDIGLETIRKKCPHFGNWLHQLENLNR